MLIDSHCHLNFKELAANLATYLDLMVANEVAYALCVATSVANIAEVISLATNNHNLFAAVGIHPEEKALGLELSVEDLIAYAQSAKVVAIGETGLDYYWNADADKSLQQRRFQSHILAAKATCLPLVVHTRNAAQDTWQLLKDEGITECGAVIHCFTESLEWARKFLDLGCYISFSGIVTFKNAKQIQEVARFVPVERLLVETDAPYLAPVPYRGKLNHPALVKHTAQFIADLKQVNLAHIAQITSENFFELFKKASQIRELTK